MLANHLNLLGPWQAPVWYWISDFPSPASKRLPDGDDYAPKSSSFPVGEAEGRKKFPGGRDESEASDPGNSFEPNSQSLGLGQLHQQPLSAAMVPFPNANLYLFAATAYSNRTQIQSLKWLLNTS